MPLMRHDDATSPLYDARSNINKTNEISFAQHQPVADLNIQLFILLAVKVAFRDAFAFFCIIHVKTQKSGKIVLSLVELSSALFSAWHDDTFECSLRDCLLKHSACLCNLFIPHAVVCDKHPSCLP